MLIMEIPHVEGYDLGAKVGGGSFSTVYMAKPRDGNTNPVAIKCIHRGKRAGVDLALAEIRLMKSLVHKNIVRYYECSGDSKYVYIIMEYCNEGDLSKLLRKRYKLVESLVQMFMQHLALAIQYLRQHNICHMDLKPQNLLLTRDPGLTLKVADFGLSRILSESNLEQSRFAGSIRYMAPEKLLNMKYDSKIDLWSIGVIMFECLVGRTPFGNLKHKQICEFMSLQKPMPIPESVNISPSCEDLLYKLLRYNPQERISYEDYYAHEFLNIDYFPCEENFAKVTKLMLDSMQLERERKYKEAMLICQKVICYMESFVNLETKEMKRFFLAQKLREYKHFEEKLGALLATRPNTVTNTSEFNALHATFKGTPSVLAAIEIGMAGEMYYVEGRFDVALNKFTTALDILMPLLEIEPQGPRKEILCRQITKWLTFAEGIKELTKMEEP